jgi:hypothetical protein
MSKEINEKTFELNITNELLNLSKSFIWYLNHSPIIDSLPKSFISTFINQATLFAHGLTQEEESNSLSGGYDVSINYSLPDGQEGRLMFLQYKAGVRKNYSRKTNSQFSLSAARKASRSSKHISFIFNDAAKGTQHSTLRNLANRKDIPSESVMYVFPRITEISDFRSKIGKLMYYSSFVPVLEIDNQASKHIPPFTINDGVIHKYRTSYDGDTTEINLLLLIFNYDNRVILEILSELICIQIERFVNALRGNFSLIIKLVLDFFSSSIDQFVEYELKTNSLKTILTTTVKSYIKQLSIDFELSKKISPAPNKYSVIIPKEGLTLSFDRNNNLSSINYQIF